MIVLMIVTTFKAPSTRCLTLDCTPPTSFASLGLDLPGPRRREEPQRHRLEMLINRFRRSCITFRPTTFVRYVWPMPMMLVTIGTAIMIPT